MFIYLQIQLIDYTNSIDDIKSGLFSYHSNKVTFWDKAHLVQRNTTWQQLSGKCYYESVKVRERERGRQRERETGRETDIYI